MLVIDKELLDGVTAQAKASPRLRMNYNLHDSLEAKAQRLMNAMEPGTDLPIHRHTHTAETYFVLRGRIEVLESGTVIFEVKDGPYTPLTPKNTMTK